MEPTLKTIDLTTKSFEANGHKYYISDKVSFARWTEYEKISPKLTYGVDFDSMYKSHGKAYAALNEKRFADAAVIMHNLMSGIKDANDDSRVHPALEICALIINREGEDMAEYNKAFQLEKINDWQTEGFDILSFFALALRSISGFRETYLEYLKQEAQKLIDGKSLLREAE